MRDHLSNALRSFVCALTAAALGALAIALMLTLYDTQRTVEMAVGLWAALLLVQALVNEALTARDVSMLVYAAVNCVLLFFGGEKIVSSTVFIPGSSGFPILLRLLIWISGLSGAWACQKLPGSNVFVRLGDVLIVSASIVLATAFALDHTFNLPILAFALLTLVLALAVASSLRAGGESGSVIRGAGMGGWLVLLLLLALCLLLAGGLLSLSSGHVDSLVGLLAQLWAAFCRVCAFLVSMLARLIALFSSNPKAVQYRYAQEDSLAYSLEAMEEAGTAPDWIVYLVMGLIAVLVLLCIAAFLWMLHGQRLGRARRKTARRRITRKSHLLAALRELVRRITARVSFELAYRTHRKTPQGLYIFARRACRIKLLPQKKSESAGAYLRRLHGVLLSQGSASSLDQLAAMLDRALYGGETPVLSAAEYRGYAEQIRAIAFPRPAKSP